MCSRTWLQRTKSKGPVLERQVGEVRGHHGRDRIEIGAHVLDPTSLLQAGPDARLGRDVEHPCRTVEHVCPATEEEVQHTMSLG
jgi:hypothetical protein